MLGPSKFAELSVREFAGILEAGATTPGGGAYLTRVTELLVIEQLMETVALSWMTPANARGGDVENVVRMIITDSTRNWSLHSMSREAGLSRSLFAEKFSSIVGQSPMAFVAEHRLKRAAQLLEADDATVAQVANLVGYDSPAAFCRRFARQFGVTPSAYKRSRKSASITDDAADWFSLFCDQPAHESSRRPS